MLSDSVASAAPHSQRLATACQRIGNGPAVVLVHGVGMDHSFWKPQVASLSPSYSVIAYDLLGHGASPLPGDPATLAEFSEHLIALLDALAIRTAHLVGHSMGALVVLETALSFPDRVASVTALNAVYCRSAAHRAAIIQRAHDLVLDDAMIEATIARWFGSPIAPEQQHAAAEARALLQRVDPTGYRRTYRLFAIADTAHVGRLPTLKPPALFLTGELDPNSTPEMSRAMARIVPNGRAVIIPQARHMMSMTAPEEVNRLILEFLDACEATAAVAAPRAAQHGR